VNPSAGGLLGGTTYQGSGGGGCNCNFTSSYPLAIGPRSEVAYQFGFQDGSAGRMGLIYGTTATTGYLTGTAISGVGWNQLSFSTGSFGTPAVQVAEWLAVHAGGFDRRLPALTTRLLFPSTGQINSPPLLHRPQRRPAPPRINQWNIPRSARSPVTWWWKPLRG